MSSSSSSFIAASEQAANVPGSSNNSHRLSLTAMSKRLGKFELPNKLTKVEEGATPTYAKFIAEPFEAGYGHTVGNSLRRVLLSSIEGAAISSIKIDGVNHEFQSIDGVVEDVTDVVLNLKKVLI